MLKVSQEQLKITRIANTLELLQVLQLQLQLLQLMLHKFVAKLILIAKTTHLHLDHPAFADMSTEPALESEDSVFHPEIKILTKCQPPLSVILVVHLPLGDQQLILPVKTTMSFGVSLTKLLKIAPWDYKLPL